MPSDNAGSALRRRFEEADAPPAAVTSGVVAPPVNGASIREAYPTDVPDVQRTVTSMTPTEIISSAARQPLADVITSPEAQSADIPQSQSPTLAVSLDQLRERLQPDPNTIYGSPIIEGAPMGGNPLGALFSPFGRNPTTGETHFVLPPALRSLALGALDIGQGRVMVDPNNPLYSVRPTPDTLAVVGGFASPLRLAGREAMPAGLARREAPLSPEFRASPGVTEPSITGPVSGNPNPLAVPAPKAPEPTPLSAPPEGAQISARQSPPSVAPQSAAEAKSIASAWYDRADQAGGTLTPAFTNKFIDTIQRIAPQTEAGAAVAGETPITGLIGRMESLRDQPISLKGAQEIDEALGNLIDREYGVKGLSKDGKALFDLQSTFRDMIDRAGSAEVGGGSAGFDALVQARKAWSQAMKMGDLERIEQRAGMTDNPATSFRTGIRTLLSSTRSRGYSDAERAALEQAAERGILGGTLHVFGSRLIPMAAGVAGFGSGGPLAGIAAAGATHAATTLLRQGATSLQSRRLRKAYNALAADVPEPPT